MSALYISIIGFFVLVVFLLRAPIVNETEAFRHELMSGDFNFEMFGFKFTGQEAYRYVQEQLSHIQVGDFLQKTGRFLSGIVAAFTAFVISFYFLLDKNGIEKTLSNFLPLNIFEDAVVLIRKIEVRLGHWLRGQLSLMAIIGVASSIGLFVMGIPYAFTLGLIAGLTEAIPAVGPLIAGLLAVLITAATAPDKIWLVIILFTVIQWAENHFIVPQVMKRALGLSPVVVIISILIGAKLMGAIGAVLAVPTVAAFSLIIVEWPRHTTRVAGKPAK